MKFHRAKENGKLVQSLLKDNLIQSSKRHLGAFLERYPAAKEQPGLDDIFFEHSRHVGSKKIEIIGHCFKTVYLKML